MRYRERMIQIKADTAKWLAWRLPRPVVKWAFVRVAAAATTGVYERTVVPELSMMDALKRWDDPTGEHAGDGVLFDAEKACGSHAFAILNKPRDPRETAREILRRSRVELVTAALKAGFIYDPTLRDEDLTAAQRAEVPEHLRDLAEQFSEAAHHAATGERSARRARFDVSACNVVADVFVICVEHPEYFRAGDHVLNTRTGEQILVKFPGLDGLPGTAMGGLLTVERGVGSMSAYMKKGDELYIIGPRHEPRAAA